LQKSLFWESNWNLTLRVVAIVAVVATALPTPVATIKQSWQLQIDTNNPNKSRLKATSRAKRKVAAASAVLPTPAVTTKDKSLKKSSKNSNLF
jgi:hypothetical protein